VSEFEKFPTLRVREFLQQKGGRALVGEVYEAVAASAAEAIGKHQEGLEKRLRDDLLTVWRTAEAWRTAKKAAWQDLGINPEIMRGLRQTVIYLPDIAPELKDAFGAARAGQGY
jgi:hypothetical protein